MCPGNDHGDHPRQACGIRFGDQIDDATQVFAGTIPDRPIEKVIRPQVHGRVDAIDLLVGHAGEDGILTGVQPAGEFRDG